MSDDGRNPQNVRPKPAGADADRQVRKTRGAIVVAFNELILARRDEDIIERADVGRSTFDEHSRDKGDMLRQSLPKGLCVVADAVRVGCDATRPRDILDHFQEDRRLARGLLTGPSAHVVTDVLASLVEEHLAARIRVTDAKPSIPLPLVAAQGVVGRLGGRPVGRRAPAASRPARIELPSMQNRPQSILPASSSRMCSVAA